MINNYRQHKKDTIEAEAVALLCFMLAKSGQISPNIAKGDKEAHIDGYIKITTSEGRSIGKLEVQVKGVSKEDKSPKYSVKKEFLEYCISNNIPVILILVYVNSKKAFWMHMDEPKCREFLTNIKNNRTKTKHLSFDDTHYIQEGHTQHCISEFIQILEKQKLKLDNYDIERERRIQLENTLIKLNELNNVAIGKSNKIYREIHNFLDFYNKLLDNDFRVLKESLYPDYWKIGIGLIDYNENVVNYVLYPISFEMNDVQIKQFEQANHSILKSFEAIKHCAHFTCNPIKLIPQQYAYKLIKDDIIQMVTGQLNIPLIIKDFFLATEHIFDFVNNYYNILNLPYGQSAYTLADIEHSINLKLPVREYFSVYPSLKITNIKIIKELIQYLKNINIHEIKRDNYYVLFNLEQKDIIKTRKIFYDTVSKIYDLFVKTYFPNLIDELSFFKGCNLLIFTIDFSRAKAFSGIGTEHQYYFKSLTPTTDKIVYYSAEDSLVSPIYKYFHEPLEIEGVQYLLKTHTDNILNQCEPTPIITLIHNLLKSRLSDYLDAKIANDNKIITT